MNKNQVKGMTKNVVGNVQEKADKPVGSKEQQAKGAAKQVAGQKQMSIADIENSAEAYNKHLGG